MDTSGLHIAQHFCLRVEGLKFMSALLVIRILGSLVFVWVLANRIQHERARSFPARSCCFFQHQQWLSLYLLAQKQEHLAKGGNTL